MKRGTPDHPKMKALARTLRIPLPYAVGAMEMIWHFTADYAPTGAIGRFSDDEIAEAAGWARTSPAHRATAAPAGGGQRPSYRIWGHGSP